MAKTLRPSVCATTLIIGASVFVLALTLVSSSRAQTTYTYTAETNKPVAKAGAVIAGALKWECDASRCTNSGPWKALGIEACRSLAQVVGPIKSFGRLGVEYDATQLSDCNKISSGFVLLDPSAALVLGPAIREGSFTRSRTSSRPSSRIQNLGTICTTDDQCDDGEYCTGREFCMGRRCRRIAVDCDDGVACTLDACVETTASCSHEGPDIDGDSHKASSCLLEDGSESGDDCDDADVTRYPGAVEVCDAVGHDEDCDVATVGTKDSDGDWYVDANCTNDVPGGIPNAGTDCDDAYPAVHPGASELCNDIDDDCDGTADDDAPKVTTWPDNDRDGFGDPRGTITERCLIGEFRGWSLNDYDCDDGNPRRHPGTSCP